MHLIASTNILILSVTLYLTQDIVINLYTKDKLLADKLRWMFFIVAATSFPDSYKGFIRGVTKALGQ